MWALAPVTHRPRGSKVTVSNTKTAALVPGLYDVLARCIRAVMSPGPLACQADPSPPHITPYLVSKMRAPAYGVLVGGPPWIVPPGARGPSTTRADWDDPCIRPIITGSFTWGP